jgi:hypothetical protein
MCTVDWIPLLSTVGGAAIALIGTVLADILRSRGYRDRDNRAERRQGYVDFVLALNAAHANLREVAAANPPVADTWEAVRRAVAEARVYEAREQLLMSANKEVITVAERAFQRLLLVRDAVRAGATLRTVAYHGPYHEYAGALWKLRRTIRHDLGASYLSPKDLDKDGWDGQTTCEVCQAALATVPTQTTA